MRASHLGKQLLEILADDGRIFAQCLLPGLEHGDQHLDGLDGESEHLHPPVATQPCPVPDLQDLFKYV